MSALSHFKKQMSDKAATKTFYAPLCPAIHNLYVANKSAPGDPTAYRLPNGIDNTPLPARIPNPKCESGLAWKQI